MNEGIMNGYIHKSNKHGCIIREVSEIIIITIVITIIKASDVTGP